MKSSLTVFAVLAALGIAACAPKPIRQVKAFWASDFISYDVHRVVVFPFAEEKKAQDASVSGTLTSCFVRELRKKSPYELIEVDADALLELKPNNPAKKGFYQTENLIEIGKRYRADAILFGSITAARVYFPQALGLRAEMVSIDTGATLWSVDAMYDAADADVENAVQHYYKADSAKFTGTEDWTVVVNSPTRFAGFVAARCTDALWKPVVKKRYTPLSETPREGQ